MKGYMGKGLRVNLTTQKISIEPLTEEFAQDYVGGYLMGMKMLWDEYKPNSGAFSPENPLIFTTGPLTGTSAPTGNSIYLNSKSPLSTFISSRAGGHFGPELKFAGYDYMVITGKAEKPTWLWIDDDHIELKSADGLWGRTCLETDSALKGIVGDNKIHTLVIGPAGEHLVKFAVINVNVDRAFGRGGSGAVMGSKNLKAIAVRGTKSVEVADRTLFKQANAKLLKELEERDAWSWEGMPKVGTSGWMAAVNYYSMLPINNFQKTHDEAIATGISSDAYLEKLKIRNYACFACPLGCSHYVPTIQEGKYAGTSCGVVEYETAAALGARCGIGAEKDDLYAVARANSLCSELGLDTISTGSAIAWAMECYERGILKTQDVDGFELKFGNALAMVEMVERIGYRKGFGDILAKGCYRAAQHIGKGADKFAMHVKGQAISASSCRTSKSIAVMFAVNERGAHHMDPYAASIDAYGYTNEEAGLSQAENPYADGNTGGVYRLKLYTKIADILGTCAFTVINLQALPSTSAQQYTAATGIPLNGQQLLQKSEKLTTLMRAFNAREGYSAKDDTLPNRFMEEKVEILVPEELQKWTGGTTKLEKAADLAKDLKDYYQEAGYDEITGLPSKAKFEALGLKKIADQLQQANIPLK